MRAACACLRLRVNAFALMETACKCVYLNNHTRIPPPPQTTVDGLPLPTTPAHTFVLYHIRTYTFIAT